MFASHPGLHVYNILYTICVDTVANKWLSSQTKSVPGCGFVSSAYIVLSVYSLFLWFQSLDGIFTLETEIDCLRIVV